MKGFTASSQRLSSITTRIKTGRSAAVPSIRLCQRLSSITTRIKTIEVLDLSWHSYNVRDYLPLQQGLRRSTYVLCADGLSRQRLSSITTRIKTFLPSPRVDFSPSQRLSSITTRIKTFDSGIFFEKIWAVRDYLPVQQGLRHTATPSLRLSPTLSETIFHYNKD